MMRTHSQMRWHARRGVLGFTLIELMITVLVVGILSAIAYPIYEHQVAQAHRTDARNALLELAAREERYFAMYNAYTSNEGDLGYTGSWPITIGSGYYAIESPNVTSTNGQPAFSLTAVTVSAYQAQEDPTCSTFTVTSTGAESSTDSAGNTNPADTCW